MREILARCVILALVLLPVLCLADSNDGLAAYKSGDYETAIPLLETALSATPKVFRAALKLKMILAGVEAFAFWRN
jgi:hypothetical protein